MRNYEVTFIVDPVLSGDEVKATAQKYVDQLQENNCEIVHVDEMGLRRLAYEINKRHTGYYYCIEFRTENGAVIDPLELNMRRDERILRFLTVKLDKYGVKYNEDKRAGKIGKAKPRKKAEAAESSSSSRSRTKKQSSSKTQTQQGDNLKRIEGIGPKIAEVLKAAGIDSFEKLASTSVDKLKEILNNAGDRFNFQDPTTWPEQARLAAAGEWDKLRKWQEELKAGRVAAGNADEEE